MTRNGPPSPRHLGQENKQERKGEPHKYFTTLPSELQTTSISSGTSFRIS